MTKSALAEVSREIRQKRTQAQKLQQELEDMVDYLDALQARARSLGKRSFSEAEVRKRLKL